MAKATGTTVGTLHLNTDGGLVTIGENIASTATTTANNSTGLQIKTIKGTNQPVIRAYSYIQAASGYQWGLDHLVPNLQAGANTCLLTGVANSTNDQGVFGFHYAGSNDDSNYVELGLYGNNGLLKIFKDKHAEVDTLKIMNTDMTGHLVFNRSGSYSYIMFPSAASSVLCIAQTLGAVNSLTAWDGTSVFSGKGNNLGNSTYYWGNIYAKGYIYMKGVNQYPLDFFIYNKHGNQVAEMWYDHGAAETVTTGKFGFREYSPASTAAATTTGKHETYYLPTVTTGRSDNATYTIITTKNLSSITSVGTITSGTWNGTAITASYLPTATTSAKGIMQVGSGLAVSSGTVSINGIDTTNGAETQCLTKKGTWKTFGTSNLTLGSTAGAALSNTASAGSATTAAKSDHVHPFPTAADIGAAAGSHSHGNITSTGCVTTDITIASGDYLIIGDNDKSGKIGKGPAFVSTTANKFLKDTGSFTTIAAADLPAATTSDKGAVIVGSGLAVSNGTISIDGINTSSGSTTKCLTEKGTWERKQLYYGTCETAAGTSLKEVICAEYDKVLTIGDMVVVKFTNTNSATTSGLQLTIKNTSSDTAGTAAANIKKQMNASVANLSQVGELRADTIAVFIYNGTYWILINCDYNSNNNVTQNIAATTDGLRPVLLSAYTRGTGITSASSTIRSQNVYVDTKNDNFYATAVHNAIWNDYAEYRRAKQPIAPGRVIIDTDEGAVVLATRRLQPGAQIVSDTWGHIMGETSDAKTPVAVAGRVLVYPYRERSEYHAGMSVCSAPDGTVDIMSDEEIRNFSNCIIGYVSEIPNYETWGSGNVKVDGRIWVRVK